MNVKILVTILFGTLLFGCDIVEEPYMNPIDDGNNTGETVQKVLLEEFTGHQCPNCPGGAQVASQLHDFYGDRFIVIAYHAGWFARTSSLFPIDYRTSAGEEFNTFFQVNAYPSGMVNRTVVNSNQLLNPTDWGSATADFIEKEPILEFSLTKFYNSSNRNLLVNVTAKAFSQLNALKLCVFVVEDSLVSPQIVPEDENYPNGINPEYVHNHVYRTSLNGAWGTDLFTEGAINNQTQTISVNGTINEEWNVENLSIVCFAYEVESGEVIQTEDEKVD